MAARDLRARSYEALVAFDYVKKGWTLGAAVFQAMPRFGGPPTGEVADDVIRLAKESGFKIKKHDPREHYIVNDEGVTLSVYRGRAGAEDAHRATRRANMAGARVASPMLTPDEYSLLDHMAKYGPADLFSAGGEKINLVRSGFIAKAGEVKGRAIHAITPAGLKMLKKARVHYG